MFRKLLDPDNPLMITMTQITDCIFLSLFFLLGCLPLITAGASAAAMYDAVYHAFRQREKNSWQRFLGSFRSNLRSSLAPTAVFLPLAYLLVKGTVALWNAAVGGSLSWMLFSAGAFLAVCAFGILSVLFPLLSRFDNSFGTLLKNTLLLAVANLPRSIALGLLNVLCGLLCLRFVFPMFFLPALTALIGTLFLEPMFRPYMPHEDTAE